MPLTIMRKFAEILRFFIFRPYLPGKLYEKCDVVAGRFFIPAEKHKKPDPWAIFG